MIILTIVLTAPVFFLLGCAFERFTHEETERLMSEEIKTDYVAKGHEDEVMMLDMHSRNKLHAAHHVEMQ